MSERPTGWDSSKGLARHILHDRTLRRKAMARVLVLLMVVFSIGLWVIDDWLAGGIMRFVLWWGGCACIAMFLMLFAAYDAMRVIREERERL